MNENEKLELLAEAFDMEPEELWTDQRLADLEEYDSMAKISLIALMDDEFSKKLTRSQIKEFQTVRDILEYME